MEKWNFQFSFNSLKIAVLHRFLEKPNPIYKLIVYDEPNRTVKLFILLSYVIELRLMMHFGRGSFVHDRDCNASSGSA